MVTVIITCYNQREFIQETIKSVLRDEFPHKQIIVVDDGSKDGSYSHICKFVGDNESRKDCSFVTIKKKNGGKSSALNEASKFVKGDYVCIVDGDDLVTDNGISARIKHAKRNNCDVVIGGFDIVSRGKKVGYREAPSQTSAQKLIRDIIWGFKSPFSLNACLVSRSIYDNVHRFDEYMSRGQDQDFTIRMLKTNPKIGVINDSVYVYRKHRKSVAKRLKVRSLNVLYSTYMCLKHHSIPVSLVSSIYNLIIGTSKLVYEIGSEYKN